MAQLFDTGRNHSIPVIEEPCLVVAYRSYLGHIFFAGIETANIDYDLRYWQKDSWFDRTYVKEIIDRRICNSKEEAYKFRDEVRNKILIKALS